MCAVCQISSLHLFHPTHVTQSLPMLTLTGKSQQWTQLELGAGLLALYEKRFHLLDAINNNYYCCLVRDIVYRNPQQSQGVSLLFAVHQQLSLHLLRFLLLLIINSNCMMRDCNFLCQALLPALIYFLKC